MRLAIIVTHPVQYLASIFRELDRELGLDLKVFLAATTDRNFLKIPTLIYLSHGIANLPKGLYTSSYPGHPLNAW